VILSTLRRRWRGSIRARPARPFIAPMPRRQRGPIAGLHGRLCCAWGKRRSPNPRMAVTGQMRSIARPSWRTQWPTPKATPFGKLGLRSSPASSPRKPTTRAFPSEEARSWFATASAAFDTIRAHACPPRSSWPVGAALSRSRRFAFAARMGSRLSFSIGCVSLWRSCLRGRATTPLCCVRKRSPTRRRSPSASCKRRSPAPPGPARFRRATRPDSSARRPMRAACKMR
jgi:hypothetical protein